MHDATISCTLVFPSMDNCSNRLVHLDDPTRTNKEVNKIEDKTLLAIVSMCLIAGLEAVAMLVLGIDGIALSATIGTLAGLGGIASGFELAKRKDAG